MTTRTPGARRDRPGGAGRRRRRRPAASRSGRSAGSCRRAAPARGRAARPSAGRSTTNSASTTIRRLILDWPTRRSRNVIGTSIDAGAEPRGAVGHLDLEHVPARADAVERHGCEGRRAPRLEAAGEVVRLEAEHDPREHRAAAGDDPADDAPVLDAAALRVARADRRGRPCRPSIGAMSAGSAFGSCDQSASIWTIVVAPPRERLAEPVEVRAPEALLRGPVLDADRGDRPPRARPRGRRSRRASRRRRRAARRRGARRGSPPRSPGRFSASL